MTWLNDNSGAIQAVSTGVLVVVTIAYAVIAHLTRIAASADVAAQRQDAVRPALTISTQQLMTGYPPSTGGFEAVIANRGVGPAFNVVVKLPPWARWDRRRYPDGPPNAYQVMGPSDSLTLAIRSQTPEDGQRFLDADDAGELRVVYNDVFGNQHESIVTITCFGTLVTGWVERKGDDGPIELDGFRRIRFDHLRLLPKLRSSTRPTS